MKKNILNVHFPRFNFRMSQNDNSLQRSIYIVQIAQSWKILIFRFFENINVTNFIKTKKSKNPKIFINLFEKFTHSSFQVVWKLGKNVKIILFIYYDDSFHNFVKFNITTMEIRQKWVSHFKHLHKEPYIWKVHFFKNQEFSAAKSPTRLYSRSTRKSWRKSCCTTTFSDRKSSPKLRTCSQW